ncbi:hypothetical protein APSETT444_003911 [Aspergillus pseudonomiae]
MACQSFGPTPILISKLSNSSIYKGWASFDLYRESSVSLRSGGGISGAVAVDTYAESRIQSDWGRVLVNFPAGAVDSPLEGTSEGRRADDKVSTAEKDNIPQPPTESPEGFIEVGTTTRVGTKMHLKFASPELTWVMEDEQHGSPNHVQWVRLDHHLDSLTGSMGRGNDQCRPINKL